MVTLSMRVRRARSLARITQSELARRLNVKRSAVSQWESESGTTPSVMHLIQIACETGVFFEWLATGRGSTRPEADAFSEAAVVMDFAQDELESRVLNALRRLSWQKKQVAVSIVELLSGVTTVDATRRIR